MQIYNTMSKHKEEFTPQVKGKVSMYACGITAYDFCHIGHARSAIVFDVLSRYLTYKGNDVTFVRNFTDVDDKIINRANTESTSPEEIAERYIAAFHEDMDRLMVRRATIEPKATDYIQEMIELCEKLIKDGHAYSTPSGDVYFRVRSYPEYGKLSGRDIDDMRSGARVAIGEEKEDPLDFALWKGVKPSEPYWESPWGKGRPGWHIECSAMSERNLPLPLDIHGGGQDLIFPHHENEIAQSEAALGKEFAKFWVHNGFVQIDSEKMSKSLNNFKTIRDILELRNPEALRFFLISKHYRSPIDFSFDTMDDAEKGFLRVYECFSEAETALEREYNKKLKLPAEIQTEFDDLKQAFYTAMDDDFNTAAALGHIFGIVRLVNRVLEDKGLRGKDGTKAFLESFLKEKDIWAEILGVFGNAPKSIIHDLRLLHAKRLNINVDEVERLLEERNEAKTQKDFAKSDAVRETLKQMHVEVRDTPNGQVWAISQEI